jgi:hypothetical protein
MAEDTVNAAIKVHNLKAGPSKTVGLYLQGGKDWSPTLYIRLVQDYGLESEVGGSCQVILLFPSSFTVVSNRAETTMWPLLLGICVLGTAKVSEEKKMTQLCYSCLKDSAHISFYIETWSFLVCSSI